MRTTAILLLTTVAAFARMGVGSPEASSTMSYVNLVDQDRVTSAQSPITTDSFRKLAHFAQLLPPGVIPELWITRSEYSSNTGTVVRGLFGRVNGTLVNGPTWGTAGISFERASQQRMTASSGDFPSRTYNGAFIVATRGDTGVQGMVGDFLSAGLTARVELGLNASGVLNAVNANGADPIGSITVAGGVIPIDTLFFAGVLQTEVSAVGYRDNNITYGTLRIPSAIAAPIIAGRNVWRYQGVVSMVGYFSSNSPLSEPLMERVRAAYKATIGSDQSLP